MTMDLTSFVRIMRSMDPATFGPDTIGELLREARIDDPVISSFPTRENGYTRNLIYKCEGFEVLILRWSAGATSLIHDHADQQCWFSALSGCFDLTNYRRRVGGWRPGYASIEATDTVNGVSIGEPDYRYGSFDIHRVSVPATSDATSVHIYAQPVRSCLVYDEARSECRAVQVSYDTVLRDRLWLANA